MGLQRSEVQILSPRPFHLLSWQGGTFAGQDATALPRGGVSRVGVTRESPFDFIVLAASSFERRQGTKRIAEIPGRHVLRNDCLDRGFGARRSPAEVVAKLAKKTVRGSELSPAQASDQGVLDFIHDSSHDLALMTAPTSQGHARHALVIHVGMAFDEPFGLHALEDAAHRRSRDLHHRCELSLLEPALALQ